jgi:tetratricopeptide (TPR) repeat protein
MNASNRTSPPSSKTDFPAYEALLQKPLAFGFKEPQFQLNVAFAEARLGDFASAIKLLQEVIRDDPRNSSATETLARIYEYQSNWAPAIELRQKMVDLDPFNPLNLLQLGKDEKSSGNLKSAQAVIPLIDAFAPKSVEAKKAHADLGK